MKEWTEVLADREGLSEEEIHWLTDNQERRSFAKNEIVVHKDEVDSNVYIITKGILQERRGSYCLVCHAGRTGVFRLGLYFRRAFAPVLRGHDGERGHLPFQRRTAQAFQLLHCHGKFRAQDAGELYPALRELAHGLMEKECLRTLPDAFGRISGGHPANPHEVHRVLPGCHGTVIEPHPGIAERNEMTTYHFAQNEQEVKQMNIRFEPVPRNEFGDLGMPFGNRLKACIPKQRCGNW